MIWRYSGGILRTCLSVGLLEKPGGLGMLAVLTDGVGAGEFIATAHRGRGAGGKEPAEAIVMRQDGLSGVDYLVFESVDIKISRWSSCCSTQCGVGREIHHGKLLALRRLPFSGPSRPLRTLSDWTL